jgi:hypothetical protein
VIDSSPHRILFAEGYLTMGPKMFGWSDDEAGQPQTKDFL